MHKKYLLIHADEDLAAAHSMISPMDLSSVIVCAYRPTMTSVTYTRGIGPLILWSAHLAVHTEGLLEAVSRLSGRGLVCTMDETPVPERLTRYPVHYVGSLELGVDAKSLLAALPG